VTNPKLLQEILTALNLPEKSEYLSVEGVITNEALIDIRDRIYRHFRILHTAQGIINDLTDHFEI